MFQFRFSKGVVEVKLHPSNKPSQHVIFAENNLISVIMYSNLDDPNTHTLCINLKHQVSHQLFIDAEDTLSARRLVEQLYGRMGWA